MIFYIVILHALVREFILMADAELSKPVWQIQRMAEELLVGDAKLALPSSCSCIQWRMEALVLVVFQHEGKRLLPCLHVDFLLVWCCLPIGWLVDHNGGHMRRSAWISDTDGLLFSSVFACKTVTLAVCERFSRCTIRSPKISVFLPWSLSYSWFSYFLIALVLSQKKKDQWIIILV